MSNPRKKYGVMGYICKDSITLVISLVKYDIRILFLFVGVGYFGTKSGIINFPLSVSIST